MSKSLKRVEKVLSDAGIAARIMEVPSETRTAKEAAAAAGCDIDQIAKSIIFQGTKTGQIFLFITAGGNQVDIGKATALTGEPLARADAASVRKVTGFAIGGVAPIGHLSSSPTFFDIRLLDFGQIWAAAGTPRHIFSIDPAVLVKFIDIEPSDFTD